MPKLPRARFFIILAILGVTLSYFRIFTLLGNSRAGHALRNGFSIVIQPAGEKMIMTLRVPGGILNNIKDKQKLLRENKRLLDLLEKERHEKELWKEKAKTFLKLHDFETRLQSSHPDYGGVFAAITAVNSNLLRTTMRINRGRGDQIRTGNAVLSINGLAGRVVETFSRASTVMLLVNPSSYTGVRVERTREAYILAGTGSGCVLQFVPQDADIRTGDRLITSGLSETLPPGIPVGKIHSISRQAERSELYIRVTPYVKFTSLEHVFVLQNAP